MAEMQKLTTNGLSMPRLGLGTWPMRGTECRNAVESALEIGYRHIDTAEMYDNEADVGAAVAASGLRSQVHITSKVWWTHLEPAALRRSCEESLARLRTDYIDLYLIHWPAPGMDLRAALGEMGRLHQEGRVRAVGISNFPVALMRSAVAQSPVPIACNQVEYHVQLDQSKVLACAREHAIAVTAYAPTAKAKVAELAVLQRIARKYDASPIQIALAWLLDQPGVAAIPKAATPANQRSNFAAQHITLDDDDRRDIAHLPKNRRNVAPDFAPLWD